jgi:pimeloyl-ACP methyl ester carboxylesterase
MPTWNRRSITLLSALGVAVFAALGAVFETQVPSWAASGLLHPMRRAVTSVPARRYERIEYSGDGVILRGWRFPAEGRRGTLVFLHGVADNRQGVIGVADQFVPLGFDVVAYDSRAHGESTGDSCTYGFHEKRDLARVLATLGEGPVVLVGQSLGAAVALQTAAANTRVSAIVAAETFSDLRTIARERAPRILRPHVVGRAFDLAEQRAAFRVDAVSPVQAATQIVVPVLLVHGARDVETPLAHSERVYAALRGPKRLIVVADAGHSRSLTSAVWRDIEAWVLARH